MSSVLHTFEAAQVQSVITDQISNVEIYEVFETEDGQITNSSVVYEVVETPGDFVAFDPSEIVNNGEAIFSDPLPQNPQANLSALNDQMFGEFGREQKNELGLPTYQYLPPPWASNSNPTWDMYQQIHGSGAYGMQQHNQYLTAHYEQQNYVNQQQAMHQQQPYATGSQKPYAMTQQQQPAMQNPFLTTDQSTQFHQNGHYHGDNTSFTEDQSVLQMLDQTSEQRPQGKGKKKKTSQSTKRSRATISFETKMVFEAFYTSKLFPNTRERKALGEQHGLEDRQVQVWFQNRRRLDRLSGAPRADPRGRKSKSENNQG